MSQLNVFITGSNAGIGYETIKALLQSTGGPGYRVFMGSRSMEKAKEAVSTLRGELAKTKAVSEVEPIQIDIADDE